MHPFLQPAPIRRGLPANAYATDEFYTRENARLFPASWVFAGFAHELPQVGDAMPVKVAEQPVVLLRGEDQTIRAFHNICRHRCLRLVVEAGNVGRLIRCPYHSWSYDLQGNLRSAPFFGGNHNTPPPGFKVQDNGLLPLRCETWHDWVFVNLDGAAMAFDEFIAPAAERLQAWDLPRAKPVATLDFGAIECNWKFLLENFIEPYHVQFVHSTTTDQPLTDHEAFADRHCLGCRATIPPQRKVRVDTLAVDSHYITLFPNFVLATYSDNELGVHLNAPASCGRTLQRRVIYLFEHADAAKVDALRELWRKVHREDHAICERMQEGRASSGAEDGGWLSPVWEASVRRFQELVWEGVGGS